MADRRIAYGVLVIAAVVLYLFYEAFYSWYLLLAVLLCPLFSLIVSFPAMCRVRVELAAPDSIIKGQSCEISVHVKSTSPLPFGRLSFSFFVTDGIERELLPAKRYALSGYGGFHLPVSIATEHCGILSAGVEDVRVTDLLGLFSHRVKETLPRLTMVLPSPTQPASLPPLPEDGPVSAKVGGGFAEDYELRDYRPGDTVRNIHWKLSAKTDTLLLREPMVPQSQQCQISLAFGGDADRVDATLEHLSWISVWLIGKEIPHCFYWYDRDAELQARLITNRASLDSLLKTLLFSLPPEAPRYPLIPGAFCLDSEQEEAQS